MDIKKLLVTVWAGASASAVAVIPANAAPIAPAVAPPAATSHIVKPMNTIWDRVVKVTLSYVSCEAARFAIRVRYPLSLSVCIPNPDGNGTWLVVLRPRGGGGGGGSWSTQPMAS